MGMVRVREVEELRESVLGQGLGMCSIRDNAVPHKYISFDLRG